jgi:D-3-phosphoglycerate dehydrogenase
MIGRVGTCFGENGVNIISAAVGLDPAKNEAAVMVVTTSAPVPQEIVEQIVASDGFVDGAAVSL